MGAHAVVNIGLDSYPPIADIVTSNTPRQMVVFVDYQNAYRAARNTFHNHLSDPHWAGQIHPRAFGGRITRLSGAPDRVLHQVRMHRGDPAAPRTQRLRSS
jgi:hypothetical protein